MRTLGRPDGWGLSQRWQVPDKICDNSPYADPEVVARKLVQLANSGETIQDGRIYIELLNGPMLFELKATPAEYGAGQPTTFLRPSDRCSRRLVCMSRFHCYRTFFRWPSDARRQHRRWTRDRPHQG